MVGGRLIRVASKFAWTFRWEIILGKGGSVCEFDQTKARYWSSSETELVRADDPMPAICWTRYFLKAQGYNVKDNVLFQDKIPAGEGRQGTE
jgi:hypothetical protein